MKAILLDIEGTTTPIDFVHKTLFPYASARVAGFVQQNIDSLKFEIGQLEAEHSEDNGYTNGFRPDSTNSVAEYLVYLIDNDRKSTPLKSIQGMIWEEGYASGDLVSQVFADVPAAFERWKNDGLRISIYSSGSVLAQKLIFKYSDQGDLTRFISDYFDTNMGMKKEPSSYWNIAKELEINARDILFVSDIPVELDAAREGGYQTALSVRPGNAPIDGEHSHRVINSFDELTSETIQSRDGDAAGSPG